jgi:D-alanyl-D-alanine carboxypeptidase/D-alanyl-D-alanine carboxypeptidase (penicillin-binding protein 5/6)
MKKIHFIIFLSLLLFLWPGAAYAKSINIPGDIAYILVDSKTGQVIAQQNADQRLRPASTTKIMTAIIALENGKLDQIMNISQNAVYDIGRGGMNVGIMAGEKGLSLENMLNLLLIKSANETANIIAENVAPTRSEFMKMMNQKAKDLGAVNTTFINPCGKDTEKEDAGHLTTPRDLAAIARYAMTIPKFRDIVATEYYKEMPVTDKHDDWGILRNTNQFLWYDNTYPYTLDGAEHKYKVIGMKTGYTAVAGNNLVTAATGEDGMELISVVMHVTQPNKIYGYSKELMKYGFEHYSMQKISEAGQLAATVPVAGAKEDAGILDLITGSSFSSALPIESNVQDVTTKINVSQPVKAPVQKGDILGNVEYRIHNVLLGKVDIIAAKSIEQAPASIAERTGPAKKSGSPYSYVFLGILLILSGLVILRIILRKVSQRVKKRKSDQKYPE